MTNPEQSPVNVLWLVKGLGPGGMERLLLHHARAGDRQRLLYRAAYLVERPNSLVPELEAAGVRCSRLGAGFLTDPRWLLDLRQLVRTERIQVVHIHSPAVAAVARVALRTMRNGPKVVYTEHNSWASHGVITRVLNAATYPLDHDRVAVSDQAKRSSGRLGRSTEVVMHGIDLAGARAAADRVGVRAELGLAEEEFVVGIAANLRETKAYPVLLDAVAALRRRGVELTVLSMGQGPLEQELHRRHSQLGLGESFRFLGFRNDATRVLSACDVVALSSDDEGLPLAVMEAKALGLPVVATEVGGLVEMVHTGRDGVLVPPRRPDLLADAIQSLAEHPDLRDRLASGSAASSIGYDRQRYVQHLDTVYRRNSGEIERIRLLYVIDSLAVGGAESSLVQMIPRWIAGGTEVHVASLKDEGGLREQFLACGATVHLGLGLRFAGMKRLVQLIRATRPHVVHTTLFESDLAGQLAARWCRVPSVTTWATMSYAPGLRTRSGIRRSRLVAAWAADVVSANLAGRVHAVSFAVAEWNRRRLLVRRSRISVIPRGRATDLTGIRKDIDRRAVRADLGVAEGVPLLLAVARHEPAKGLDVVVRALASMTTTPPPVLLIAGRNGTATRGLHRLVLQCSLEERVRMLGVRDDVPTLIACADVVVSGSREEGSPGALLEAMAIGTPIVATDIGPNREVLGGAHGTVPCEDAAALASAVDAQLAIGADAEVERRQRRFLEKYQLEVVADRLGELHRSIALHGRAW